MAIHTRDSKGRTLRAYANGLRSQAPVPDGYTVIPVYTGDRYDDGTIDRTWEKAERDGDVTWGLVALPGRKRVATGRSIFEAISHAPASKKGWKGHPKVAPGTIGGELIARAEALESEARALRAAADIIARGAPHA